MFHYQTNNDRSTTQTTNIIDQLMRKNFSIDSWILENIYVSYIFIIKTTHLTSFLLQWVILIWLLSVVIFCLLCSVTTIGPQLIALQFSYNLKLNWKRCEEQNSNTKHWPAKWTNKRNKHEQINIKSLFELMCEKINWWKHNPKLRQKITKYF